MSASTATLNRIKRNKKKLLKALVKYKGIVTYACRDVKITNSTFFGYKNQDEEFRLAVQEIEDVALDYVEQKLLDRIEIGDTVAIMFYLRSKGKKRGWNEKIEISGDNDSPIQIRVIEPYIDPLSDQRLLTEGGIIDVQVIEPTEENQ